LRPTLGGVAHSERRAFGEDINVQIFLNYYEGAIL